MSNLRSVEKRPVHFAEVLAKAEYHSESYRSILDLLPEARRRRQRERRKVLVLLFVVTLFTALTVAQTLPLATWKLAMLLVLSLVCGLTAAVPALLWKYEKDAESYLERER